MKILPLVLLSFSFLPICSMDRPLPDVELQMTVNFDTGQDSAKAKVNRFAIERYQGNALIAKNLLVKQIDTIILALMPQDNKRENLLTIIGGQSESLRNTIFHDLDVSQDSLQGYSLHLDSYLLPQSGKSLITGILNISLRPGADIGLLAPQVQQVARNLIATFPIIDELEITATTLE